MVLTLVCACLQTAPYALAETVICDATSISVDAEDIKAEDLIKTIGEACGIRMVLFGEVFNEDVFSIQFENMPIRSGLERVLRVINIPNHLMHFEEIGSQKRLVEINLIGTKGGERQLTIGAPEQPKRPEHHSRPHDVSSQKTKMEQKQEDEMEENFIQLMDEILNAQMEGGVEPDPVEVLRMFKEVIPEEMKDEIPVEVLEELERLAEE